jgi:hypothetical protein
MMGIRTIVLLAAFFSVGCADRAVKGEAAPDSDRTAASGQSPAIESMQEREGGLWYEDVHLSLDSSDAAIARLTGGTIARSGFVDLPNGAVISIGPTTLLWLHKDGSANGLFLVLDGKTLPLATTLGGVAAATGNLGTNIPQGPDNVGYETYEFTDKSFTVMFGAQVSSDEVVEGRGVDEWRKSLPITFVIVSAL